MQETLLSRFETAFSEFKKYGTFYFDFVKDYKNKREEQAKFLTENINDPEKVQEYILEYSSLPQFYAQDLDKFKERVITMYELLEDTVEFSAEIKKEMEEISPKKNPILFKIVEGKAVAVSEDLIVSLKLKAKETYAAMIENFKEK